LKLYLVILVYYKINYNICEYKIYIFVA